MLLRPLRLINVERTITQWPKHYSKQAILPPILN